MNKNFVVILFFVCLVLRASSQTNSSDELLAQQYYQNGEFEKALVVYEKLFNQSRNAVGYYDQYLNTLIKLKDYDTAEKVVKKMANSSKENFTYKIDSALCCLYFEHEREGSSENLKFLA